MAKREESVNLREYAVMGAEAAIEKLQAEIARIRRAFPELGVREPAHRAVQSRQANKIGGNEGPDARRKRTMSAEARRRISEAQKARWAKQKSESAGKKR